MNNTSACNSVSVLNDLQNYAYFIVFYVLTPMYFLTAFTGHILLLVGFVKRAKIDSAYTYQIFMTAVKTLEILVFTLFVVTFKWFSGIEMPGQEWFQKDWILMWYSAHAAVPTQNACITMSLLMAIAMAADRIYAVWKPLLYKVTNHKRQRILTVLGCIILGCSTNVFDCFRFRLEFDGRLFTAVVDSDYVGGPTAIALTNVRNTVRILGVAALVASNAILVRLYHKNSQAHSNLASSSNMTAVEQKRTAERKASERTLIIIVIGQSIAITTSTILSVAFYVTAYAKPSFSVCAAGVIFACIFDAVTQLGDMSFFILVVRVDKKIRETILTALRCKKV